ncbi:WASH complex subunit 2A-like isoform X2 [Rhinatrema bivittatum]|uniref:WASH complex subunit 2A-like isoform X2 n=1 Tax=Rhinatrema bivittatum TaxID=194408 RepID=UPI00112A76ED|nr:WASH complex subunit 2A-like isoform X2 [Rhinatrema bivittatum]
MNGPGEQDATPKEPAWERAWSVEEVRKTSQNWSLAADAGLLRFLQEFSQQTISRTHEIEKQLDRLIHETKASDCRLHSVFNDFLMLSNTQFIENRVYDEEVEEPISRHETGEKQDQEKTREQKEAELIPKIQEAVNYGLQVLDTAFEQLDIKAGNSDSEEEETNERVELILEPKDLYIDRPLPYLIGTQLFMEQEDVGLGDLSSEEGSVDSDRGSVIDSEEKDEAESSDEFGNQSEDEQKTRTALSDDEDDDGSDLFGDSEKEEEEDKESLKSKRTRPTSFADELAARIKGDVPTEHENQASPHPAESKTKKQVKEKKEARKVSSDDEDDDIFKPPKLTDEDFSPFGAKGGLFSGGRGLFDDDDESDLFAEAPKELKKEKEAKITVNKDVEPSPSSPVRKMPVGAVSLFPGGEHIFNHSSVLAEKDKKKPVKLKVDRDSKQEASAGLFDDEDDFFGGSDIKQSNSAQAKPVADLFEDEDEDSNVFLAKASVLPTDLDNTVKEAEGPKGNMIKRKNEESPEDSKPPPGPFANKQTKGLFSDEEDSEQDLFSPKLNATKSKAAALPPARTTNALSFFDEEDNLFDAVPAKKQLTTVKSAQGKTPPSHSKTVASSLLFSSDDEDHWNSRKQTKSTANQSQEEEEAATKSVSTEGQSGKVVKKTSLFSEDEEEDLFAITKDSLKKHHRASLLFEEDTKDEGSLFSINPSDTLTSQTLEQVKPQQANPALLNEKEEKQFPFEKSEKTAAEETAGTGEGPGGRTDGMFSGTNLPEQNGKITVLEDIKSEDLFTVSPPLNKEAKSKAKNVLSLFEEEEEEEDTKNQPSTINAQKEIAKPFGKNTHSKSTGVFQDEELLFSHKLQKDNDPDVDLFASAIKPAAEKSSLAKVSGSELFGDDEEEDLFSATKSKKPPNTPEKKTVVKKNDFDTFKNIDKHSGNIKHDPNVPKREANEKLTGPVPVKTKEPAPRIGKLQANLAINPASLLPGAVLKTAGQKSAKPGPSLSSQPIDTHSVVTTSAMDKKEEHGVSFDKPAQADTLHSANKNRVKVTGKRRPPTRAGRRLVSQDSSETDEISPVGDHREQISKEISVIPSARPSVSREPEGSAAKDDAMQKVSAESLKSDLFPGMNTSTIVKSQTPSISDLIDSDELFAKSSVSKSTQNVAAKERLSEGLQSKPVKTNGKKSVLSALDEQESDDLFQSAKHKPSKKAKSVTFMDEEGEDLFGVPKTAQKKDSKSKVQQDLKPKIQDIFEDDIFATEAAKPIKKKEKDKTTESNLFGENADIFADLTVKPKEKKAKKKVEPKSIFDDEMDDIFTSGNQMKMPKSKDSLSQSASEVKSESKGASTFDDPLNAFGGT